MARGMEQISQTIKLANNVKVTYEIAIPIFDAEPDKEIEKKLDIIKPMFEAQYVGAVKSVVNDYRNSQLPEKFIVGQEILVTPLPTDIGLHGLFNLIMDYMIVDANSICNIGRIPAPFLFGHEMGHKIGKYKLTDEIMRELASILGISYDQNKSILNETFADECGNMMSNEIHEHGVLPVPLSDTKRKGVKRLILQSIYRP